MAWRDAELVGFHWTKIHPDGAGEVYVIAVAPSAQGLGLGRVLLRLGLDSLYRRGCREVLLYVDGDNTGAMRLYERTGFRPHDLDVQWARRPVGTPASVGVGHGVEDVADPADGAHVPARPGGHSSSFLRNRRMCTATVPGSPVNCAPQSRSRIVALGNT